MSDNPEELPDPDDTGSPHYAVRERQGTLVGFFAFGSAAEVGDAADGESRLWRGEPGDLLTVGLGLRPDLTGQRSGIGYAFVQAGLDFARRQFAPRQFRLFVYDWNARALAVYDRAGCKRTGAVIVGEGPERSVFVEMRRLA